MVVLSAAAVYQALPFCYVAGERMDRVTIVIRPLLSTVADRAF